MDMGGHVAERPSQQIWESRIAERPSQQIREGPYCGKTQPVAVAGLFLRKNRGREVLRIWMEYYMG